MAMIPLSVITSYAGQSGECFKRYFTQGLINNDTCLHVSARDVSPRSTGYLVPIIWAGLAFMSDLSWAAKRLTLIWAAGVICGWFIIWACIRL